MTAPFIPNMMAQKPSEPHAGMRNMRLEDYTQHMLEGMQQSQQARDFNQRNRPHPDEYADLRRTQPQPRPMNPWLFGAIGIGTAAVAIALMAWGIPAAIRFFVSLLAVDLEL